MRPVRLEPPQYFRFSNWLPLHVHNHETPWKNPGHVFPGKKNWSKIFGPKKSRPHLLEKKIKQIITSIDHSITSPWTVTDWQIKSLCLLEDCYNGYRITSKNFLSSFQTQLQQLQNHTKKFSLIFSNPVTAVTESPPKIFFDLFKASYSSYRNTPKKFL